MLIPDFFLKKMITLLDEKLLYYLPFEQDLLHLNPLIGQYIKLESLGIFKCNCGKESEKPFANGFCKSCFFENAAAGNWIFRPELSKAHLGIGDRDLDFEKKVQLAPHLVYLAETDKIKVGVTRKENIPTRWLDQGALQSLALVEVPNRYLAGQIEVELKKYYADKTNYKKMLKLINIQHDLEISGQEALAKIPTQFLDEAVFFPLGKSPQKFSYPISSTILKDDFITLKFPQTIKGVLTGIKGQYLIFDGDKVFNVRNHEGQKISLKIFKTI